jgi:uncharacterized protein YcbK (DUF882 family)
MMISGKPKATLHPEPPFLTRRRFLIYASGIAAGFLTAPILAPAKTAPARSLAFRNLHTGERLTTTYWADGVYIADSLREIQWLLRDYRTGDQHAIDPLLLDTLHALRDRVGSDRSFDVISGYRSPHTNALLHNHSSGVASHSLHMVGKAIDIRLPDYNLSRLRHAAMELKAGGVGYYPKSDFIHIDTGRVRYW